MCSSRVGGDHSRVSNRKKVFSKGFRTLRKEGWAGRKKVPDQRTTGVSTRGKAADKTGAALLHRFNNSPLVPSPRIKRAYQLRLLGLVFST